jgi:hypothetical protein
MGEVFHDWEEDVRQKRFPPESVHGPLLWAVAIAVIGIAVAGFAESTGV